jgi:hypothetical protein
VIKPFLAAQSWTLSTLTLLSLAFEMGALPFTSVHILHGGPSTQDMLIHPFKLQSQLYYREGSLVVESLCVNKWALKKAKDLVICLIGFILQSLPHYPAYSFNFPLSSCSSDPVICGTNDPALGQCHCPKNHLSQAYIASPTVQVSKHLFPQRVSLRLKK